MRRSDASPKSPRRLLSELAWSLRVLAEYASRVSAQYIRSLEQMRCRHVSRRAFRAAFELRTDDEHAALARSNFERASGILSDYLARLAARSALVCDSRAPDEQLAIAKVAECAGIGMRHRAHEIEYSPRGPS